MKGSVEQVRRWVDQTGTSALKNAIFAATGKRIRSLTIGWQDLRRA